MNDHLAGSVTGLELAQRLAANNQGTTLGTFMHDLATDIESDQQALKNVMQQLRVEKQGAKQVVTWIAEKATRLRFTRAVTGSADLSRLLELEMLSMGIHGKLTLWRALGRARDDHPGLIDVDVETLAVRAEDQLERLEPHRLEAALAAFNEDRDGERRHGGRRRWKRPRRFRRR